MQTLILIATALILHYFRVKNLKSTVDKLTKENVKLIERLKEYKDKLNENDSSNS